MQEGCDHGIENMQQDETLDKTFRRCIHIGLVFALFAMLRRFIFAY
jgi:hypothetical protein